MCRASPMLSIMNCLMIWKYTHTEVAEQAVQVKQEFVCRIVHSREVGKTKPDRKNGAGAFS